MRRPTISNRTDTIFPYTTRVRSIGVLCHRFPELQAPKQEDICNATKNREQEVKAIAPEADALLVIGAPNSSNSNRLVEVAKVAGCARAYLVQRAADIDWAALDGVKTLGLTAGASAPAELVEEEIGRAHV